MIPRLWQQKAVCGCVGVKVLPKKRVTVLLLVFLGLYVLALSRHGTSDRAVSPSVLITDRPRKGYKTELGVRYTRQTVKILIWTKVFGEKDVIKDWKNMVQTSCPQDCRLTDDKSELGTSDAVVFHMADSILQGLSLNSFKDWFSVPSSRRPDQVWVMLNQEPVTMLWGDTSWWQGRINLTIDFTLDADIVIPYGRVKLLDPRKRDKEQNYWINANIHSEKSNPGAIILVSNCYDDARRYRVIDAVSKYIPVSVYGGCGAPWTDEDEIGSYQFYLALENSDCRDYVTEKFWSALERRQIPIVAWRIRSLERLVPPKSYINVYDFADLEAAGRYIRKVSENKTLYNSYFEWHGRYGIASVEPCWCQLCALLRNESIPATSYHDLQGWYRGNGCQPVTMWSFIQRVVDRVLFNLAVS